ncbi:MAG: hypothetical protein HY474_00495 [Candidatus Sungbacteria bacterium]|uniref:DUF11 domain-containing protein n=1 Tax=Candidatus Sungiibacteriota bacterium TaxID=2750080 RepID=A0A932YVH1_9BACT|nr:hypothetical protein [Candidatus Sungbacteria bacterium]
MSRLEDIRGGLYRREPPAEEPQEGSLRAEHPNSLPSGWEEPDAAPRLMDRVYLAKLRQRRFSGRTLVMLGLLALLGIAAFIGYTLFFARADVRLEILGPDRITAGEPTTITVLITNRGSVALTDGALTLTLPPGAILAGEPAPASSPVRERLTIDSVPAGGEFRRELRVQFLGRDNETLEISGLFLYRPQNVASQFTRRARFIAPIGRVPFVITVEAPERVSSGQEITVTIGVDAETSVSLPQMSLGIESPPGFELKSASPLPPADAPNLWPLGNLEAGTLTKIVLTGVLRGEPEEPKLFRVRLGRYDAGTKSWLLLTEASAGPTLASPFLLAQTTLDGNRRGPLAPGARIEGRVRFRNNLAQPVQNVTVSVSIPEQFVELETVRVEDGFYDVTRRFLTWNPASVAGLAELGPGEEDTLNFSFTLKANPPIRGFSDKNFRFPVLTTIDTGTPPPDFRGVSLAYRDTAEFQISSRLSLAARASYYDSPVPSAGPLPPKVRQTTTYTVLLQLGSGTNDVRDVMVRAVLPGGVEFGRVVSSDLGSVEFNPASRELSWRVGQVPAATGLLRPHAAAFITIAFTPAENQVGVSPPLLTAISASGRDGFTGTELSAAADDLTIELKGDSRSSPQEWRVVR